MGESDDQYFEMNRVGSDRRTAVHVESSFYDVDGFMAGASSLRENELAELKDSPARRCSICNAISGWIHCRGFGKVLFARVSIYETRKKATPKTGPMRLPCWPLGRTRFPA